MEISQNFYSFLNLNPECSDEDIDKRYKELALLSHPDKNKDGHDEFCKLNLIYRFLKTKRDFYNQLVYGNLVVYDTIHISEFMAMEYDCRCGGMYILNKLDKQLKISKVICSNCSLCIDIQY